MLTSSATPQPYEGLLARVLKNRGGINEDFVFLLIALYGHDLARLFFARFLKVTFNSWNYTHPFQGTPFVMVPGSYPSMGYSTTSDGVGRQIPAPLRADAYNQVQRGLTDGNNHGTRFWHETTHSEYSYSEQIEAIEAVWGPSDHGEEPFQLRGYLDLVDTEDGRPPVTFIWDSPVYIIDQYGDRYGLCTSEWNYEKSFLLFDRLSDPSHILAAQAVFREIFPDSASRVERSDEISEQRNMN